MQNPERVFLTVNHTVVYETEPSLTPESLADQLPTGDVTQSDQNQRRQMFLSHYGVTDAGQLILDEEELDTEDEVVADGLVRGYESGDVVISGMDAATFDAADTAVERLKQRCKDELDAELTPRETLAPEVTANPTIDVGVLLREMREDGTGGIRTLAETRMVQAASPETVVLGGQEVDPERVMVYEDEDVGGRIQILPGNDIGLSEKEIEAYEYPDGGTLLDEFIADVEQRLLRPVGFDDDLPDAYRELAADDGARYLRPVERRYGRDALPTLRAVADGLESPLHLLSPEHEVADADDLSPHDRLAVLLLVIESISQWLPKTEMEMEATGERLIETLDLDGEERDPVELVERFRAIRSDSDVVAALEQGHKRWGGVDLAYGDRDIAPERGQVWRLADGTVVEIAGEQTVPSLPDAAREELRRAGVNPGQADDAIWADEAVLGRIVDGEDDDSYLLPAPSLAGGEKLEDA